MPRFLLLRVAVSIALPFALLGGLGLSAEAAEIKLTMATWGSPEFWDFHEQGIAEFVEIFPHIDVELLRVPCCDKVYWERLVTMYAAGDMPDVFRVWSTQQTDVFRSGIALDISAFVEMDRDYFAEFFISPIALNGRVYALADVVIANYLHVNEELLAQVGVESPVDLYGRGAWDYDALAQAARRVASLGPDGSLQTIGMMMWVPSDILVGPWVQGFGGSWFGPENHAVEFTAEPALNALEWLQERFAERSFVARGTAADLENSGRWGLAFNWTLPPAPGGNYGDFRVDYVPFPRGPVRDVTTYRTEPWAVSSKTPHPSEAYELIKFMAGPGIRFMIEGQGKIPNYRPSMQLLEPLAPRFRGGLVLLSEQLGKLVPQPIPLDQRQVWDILQPALTRVMNGEVSPTAAMNEIAPQIEGIFRGALTGAD